MLICLLVAAFFVTVITGPAGVEWRERRRELAEERRRRELPGVRVVYLPSAECRESAEQRLEEWETDEQAAREAHRRAGCATLSWCAWCDGFETAS